MELKQPEEKIWRKTLRQIFILLNEHVKTAQPEEEREVYADEMVW